MIRILIADDSLLVRIVLRDALNASGDMSVIGEAGNGAEAAHLAETLKPDIVLMDILMPVMGGLEATETIMSRSPVPILILSSTLDDKDVKLAFTAIKRGALDVMGKPSLSGAASQEEFFSRLFERIRLLSRIKVIHHIQRSKVPVLPVSVKGSLRNILAIGASTGGPKAVMSIVKSLPSGFRGSVFIVQHISSGFAKGFAHWLNLESRIPVRVAKSGDIPVSGEVLVAPTDCQMILDKGAIRLLDDPAVNSCRPSIDVFFNSIAPDKGMDTVGVLLTGMGRDGAQGLSKLKQNGAFTIVQDEKSSAVFGMPKAAIALGAADEILNIDAIPDAISRFFPNTV
jgi:two-component system, chemotaxis family, protein-glutamate methylesterase/glutaminase